MPLHSAVRKHSVRVRDSQFDLIIELASDTQALVPASSMRVGVDDLERVFGNAEVQMAVVAAPDLRYLYVNAAYRNIRPEAPMVGRTYAEVFPEAAEAGAEERLKTVIATSETWIVDDYPTWLPNREVPAWWQGECVPISVGGLGYPDAALILIWDVTQRHVPEAGPLAKSETRVRIESAKAKLTARMSARGLDPARGWYISEELRETDEGTVWILRPIHMHQLADPSLVERVAFSRFTASPPVARS